jgi:transcriptional regulator with XRE-family HTH domain
MKQEPECNPVLSRILITLRLRGFRQKDLTNHLGISDVAFSKWKSRGSTAYMRYIDDIASYLRVSKDFLLFGEDSPNVSAELFPNEFEHIRRLRGIPEKPRKIIYDMIDEIFFLTHGKEVAPDE